MAVEWVRTAYQGQWLLFQDSDKISYGRYVYTDPDTPHYPGFHNLGSATWDDANWHHETILGEVRGIPRVWDDGSPPIVKVRASAKGTAECLADGELAVNSVDAHACIDGYIPQCIVPVDELKELFELASEYRLCSLQRIYTFLIAALYDDDEDAIELAVLDWLGILPTVKIHIANGVKPGVITITTDTWQIAVFDGTRNFQQVALQALAFVVGPTSYGTYSTADLWYESATYGIDKMTEDGLAADKMLFLCGHSYGGAVALNIATRLKQANPDQLIRYLTFGCPKIGDARFARLLENMLGVNLVNDDDLVTILPPDRTTLLPVIPLLPFTGLQVYTEWKRPPSVVGITLAGELLPDVRPFIDTDQLANIITRSISGLTIAPISGHRILEYDRRLLIGCPDDCWPLDEDTNFDITTPSELMAFLPLALEPKGKLILHGMPIPGVPGQECTTSLEIPLATWHTFYIPSNISAWLHAMSVAGSNHKVEYVQLSGFNNSLVCWTRACSSLNFQFIMGAPTSTGFVFTSVSTQIRFAIGSVFGARVAKVRITAL